MKLTTLVVFAAVGLLVSAPFLFDESRKTGPDQIPNPGQESFSQSYAGPAAFTSPSDTNQGVPSFQLAGSRSVSPEGNYSFSGNPSSPAPSSSKLNEPVYFAFASMEEFLRFDVTPDWVQFRWPETTTFTANDQLTGMRVPLVSGPRPQDIHGSLTYYFDQNKQVQRIGFRGWTGDATELVALVQQMGFKRKKSNGAGLFEKLSWGRLKGVLRLDHPPVVQQERPTEQLMVLFEFTNPAGDVPVSPQTMAILNAMQ